MRSDERHHRMLKSNIFYLYTVNCINIGIILTMYCGTFGSIYLNSYYF